MPKQLMTKRKMKNSNNLTKREKDFKPQEKSSKELSKSSLMQSRINKIIKKMKPMKTSTF